ncbi:MAG: GIY-YIG nuclease family protein [Candidatus Altiarchaeota archaeon]
MKGAYIVIAKLKKDENLKIGSLGRVNFRKGFYAYVGSGMGNLHMRALRHLRRDKKLHWHIDYFLKKAKVLRIYLKISNEKEECKIAENLAEKFPSVKNFGCSDCRCKSHLFYSKNFKKLWQSLLLNFFLFFSF